MSTSTAAASLFLASGSLVSRILGFAKSWLLLQVIGAVSFASAAYATATGIPNSIYAIMAQGVLNAILVPQIIKASVGADKGRAYINKLVTLGMVIFGSITIAALLIAPALISFFGLHGEQAQLGLAFAYWSLPQIFFLGLYTLLGEVLNAKKCFGPFTWAPAFNNIVAIFTLILFIWIFGTDPLGARDSGAYWSFGMVALLGGGATLGIASQALILFAFWKRIGLRFRWDFRWRGVNLGHAGRAASWTLGMLLVSQIAGIVEFNVANSVNPGDAGALIMNNAWLIFMLPHGIIAVSIATAFYTRMAESAHRRDMAYFQQELSSATRKILFFICFSSGYFIVTAYSISRIFTPHFEQMGLVLIAYSIGLIPFSLVFMMQRAFYSLNNTKTPFFFTAFQSLLIIVGILLAQNVDSSIRAATIGLVVSGATFIQATLAFILLRKTLQRTKSPHTQQNEVFSAFIRLFPATLLAIACGFITIYRLGWRTEQSFAVNNLWSAVATCAIIGVVMLLSYCVFLTLFRSAELKEILQPLISRLYKR